MEKNDKYSVCPLVSSAFIWLFMVGVNFYTINTTLYQCFWSVLHITFHGWCKNLYTPSHCPHWVCFGHQPNVLHMFQQRKTILWSKAFKMGSFCFIYYQWTFSTAMLSLSTPYKDFNMHLPETDIYTNCISIQIFPAPSITVFQLRIQLEEDKLAEGHGFR